MDVQDFLMVPQQKLFSRQVKIHKGPLSKQVENWGDVENTLKGTAFESFINADYKLVDAVGTAVRTTITGNFDHSVSLAIPMKLLSKFNTVEVIVVVFL
ncbi:hypothetical protein Leryth_019007 [Lithospermum erythrorhizon]|uniref:Uncharacterized protein n=1 Tax=Lithospermum erythrorhizon TaxID=34254 RepID=A0AAV3PBM2_LITER|nr:hypothetical protein Leryth_019007 [Lithospermum erythrorhizon]